MAPIPGQLEDAEQDKSCVSPFVPGFRPTFVLAKLLSYHQHRGLARISCFVFIHIAASANDEKCSPFVLSNIVGLIALILIPLFLGRPTRP